MHSLITNLLIFSIIRLQFVCCCGSVVPLGMMNEGVRERVECCKANVVCEHTDCCEHRAERSHQHDGQLLAQSDSVQSESTSHDACSTNPDYCDCCRDCDHEHQHHLHKLYFAKISTNTKVSLDMLVVSRAIPSLTYHDASNSHCVSVTEESFCRLDILTLLGHLRI